MPFSTTISKHNTEAYFPPGYKVAVAAQIGFTDKYRLLSSKDGAEVLKNHLSPDPTHVIQPLAFKEPEAKKNGATQITAERGKASAIYIGPKTMEVLQQKIAEDAKWINR